MSLFLSNTIDEPVGNSPGPVTTLSVTVGAWLIVFPAASSTVTSSQASSLPSVAIRSVLSA